MSKLNVRKRGEKWEYRFEGAGLRAISFPLSSPYGLTSPMTYKGAM